MSLRPGKTAADYLAIAICPALIMVLVGSLVMFLLQIGYEGAFLGRLRWTLFWFVFAMVLVSRIAIEQSSGSAILYGLLLAWATFIMLTRYLGSIWQIWLLLAIIWWASNKLVWDCTLIDEDQDASGQGLLQARRLPLWLRPPSARVRAVSTEPSAAPKPIPSVLAPPPGKPDRQSARAKRVALAKRKSQDVHSPGLWILYFSLAAVPVFGTGELLLARGDAAGRRFCFLMLFAYVSAGLALLLLTSFLGLRRYLRQRGIAMAPALASSWLMSGSMLIVLCLVLASILPRPITPYSLSHLARLRTPTATSTEGRQSDRQTTGDPDSQSQTAAGSQDREGVRDQSSPPPSPGSQGSEKAEAQARQPASSSPPLSPPALQLEKWVSYVVAAIVLALAAWWFWPELSAAFRSLLQGFTSWWSGRTVRIGRRSPGARLSPTEAKRDPLPANPFQTGAAARMPLPELVRYSFDGLQRWAQARGFTLEESETPIEFAERLAQRERVLTREILLLASYYSHVIYAHQSPPEESREVLRQLWSTIGFRQ